MINIICMKIFFAFDYKTDFIQGEKFIFQSIFIQIWMELF